MRTAVALFLASLLLTGCVRWVALRLNILDTLNARSSHSIARPRGGGLAFAVLFLGSVAAGIFDRSIAPNVQYALLGGGILVAAVGLWDDVRNLPAGVRLAAHVAAAIWVVYQVGGLPIQFGQGSVGAALVGKLVGVLALVWLINVFNFMDGIDGLAAGEAVFVAVTGACLLSLSGGAAYLTWFGLGALVAGFLPWNLPPAKIFMGDVGSGFLGFAIGTLALATSTGNGNASPWTWIILLAAFLVDATVTLIRRMGRGDTWYLAHRSHAYQRLSRRWIGHRPVTCAFLGINVLFLAPLSYWSTIRPDLAFAMAMIALASLAFIAAWLGAGLPDDG